MYQVFFSKGDIKPIHKYGYFIFTRIQKVQANWIYNIRFYILIRIRQPPLKCLKACVLINF